MAVGSGGRVPAVLVVGAPGSGKTALVKEMSEQLWQIRSPHAVIDLDELCRGVLPEPTADFNLDLAVANLGPVWANFRERGATRLLLARVVSSADGLRRVQAAVPECDIVVCRICADPAVLVERLGRREAGSSGPFLRSVAPGLAAMIAALDVPGLTVDNGIGTNITELARSVLDQLGWV